MSNDETRPVSGSRWEPAEQPPTPSPPAVAYAPAPAPRNRGRLLLAGGAVGVALVAGAGGFALGHATADDGRDGRFGRPGFGTFNGPQQRQQMPPGFQGGPGPQDGFPDPRGDDGDGQDGDGQDGNGQYLPDDGATQGSSTT